jgi:hypothetical protein
MNPQDPKYWFPIKRYGWGWGLPARWQGWAALVVWLIILLAGVRDLRSRGPLAHTLFVAGMVGMLVLLCYLKGEPLRWRGGDDH